LIRLSSKLALHRFEYRERFYEIPGRLRGSP
jgi:hypothetical protein